MKLSLFSLCCERAYKCAIFPPFSVMSSYRCVRHADNSLSLLTFLKVKQERPSYVSCNIMMRSRNHFCNGNATMRSVCIRELSVNVNNMKTVAKNFFRSKFMSPTTLKRTSCKLSDSFVDFNEIWGFSTYFHEVPISNFAEIRPVGAALIHTRGRTRRN